MKILPVFLLAITFMSAGLSLNAQPVKANAFVFEAGEPYPPFN